jgi:predicted DNA-binding transcriptional regulator AlpA
MSDIAFLPRGLSREQAAAYVGIGTTLFDQMVASGKLPKPARINSRVLWDRKKLDAALDDLFDSPTVNDFDRLRHEAQAH